MRIEMKIYSDAGELLQTITAAAEEVSLDTRYEQPMRFDFRRPIIRPENRIESLSLLMEKMIPSEDGTVYTITNTPLGQTTITPL